MGASERWRIHDLETQGDRVQLRMEDGARKIHHSDTRRTPSSILASRSPQLPPTPVFLVMCLGSATASPSTFSLCFLLPALSHHAGTLLFPAEGTAQQPHRQGSRTLVKIAPKTHHHVFAVVLGPRLRLHPQLDVRMNHLEFLWRAIDSHRESPVVFSALRPFPQLIPGQLGGAVYTLQLHSLRSYLPPVGVGRTGFD